MTTPTFTGFVDVMPSDTALDRLGNGVLMGVLRCLVGLAHRTNRTEYYYW